MRYKSLYISHPLLLNTTRLFFVFRFEIEIVFKRIGGLSSFTDIHMKLRFKQNLNELQSHLLYIKSRHTFQQTLFAFCSARFTTCLDILLALWLSQSSLTKYVVE